MIAVTTFSQTNYEDFAKKMLESIVRHWPTKIICYFEQPFDFEHENVIKLPFFSIQGCSNFYQHIKHVPGAHGLINGSYNYNYDAWKFTRKIFAQWDAIRYHSGKVFWIDADCEITRDVSEEELEKLFDGKALCYLGRPGFYTETGFVGFDNEAPELARFMEAYITCLRRGTVFTLKRWHDCEIFDWARDKSGIAGNDLSPFFKIPKDRKMSLEDLDVVSKSVLGSFLLHHKGPRKRNGCSIR